MSRSLRTVLIHGGLFILTAITTTLAGVSWVHGPDALDALWSEGIVDWPLIATGLPYAATFLLILAVHEFGHYFAAEHYRLKPTLPFYLPIPPLPYFLGTLGAYMRIRRRIQSLKENFDVGLAGPLAGFVVALVFMIYGFTSLPGSEATMDPLFDPVAMSASSDGVHVVVGNNLLFWFFETFVAEPGAVPAHDQLHHYPILFATFIALVVTALNLLPIGQLDGGHVLYGLVGHRWQSRVAAATFLIFLFYATLGMLPPGQSLDVLGYITFPHIAAIPVMVGLYYLCMKALRWSPRDTVLAAVALFATQYVLLFFMPRANGYSGWLLFAIIIGRMMPVAHPVCEIEEPLDAKRRVLGWVALFVFVICWTPQPIHIIVP